MHLDEVAHGFDDAGAQAALVRAAAGGRDAVHVAANVFVGGLGPDQRDLEARLALALLVEERARRDLQRRHRRDGGNLSALRGRFLRHAFLGADHGRNLRRRGRPRRGGHRVLASLRDDLRQVFGDAAVVLVGILARRALRLVAEDDRHAAVQVALRLQPVADEGRVEARLEAEHVDVGSEGDARARTPRLAFDLEFRCGAPLRVALHVVLAVALDPRDQRLGERVDHARPHAVQAAGVDVIPLLELPARMEGGEDHLDGGLLEFRHDVDGDAAPVVGDGDGLAVLVQGDLDARGEAVDHLVDRVVEDFPEEMVVAAGVDPADVHGGPLAHGLETLEHLDVGRAVARLADGHSISSPRQPAAAAPPPAPCPPASPSRA